MLYDNLINLHKACKNRHGTTAGSSFADEVTGIDGLRARRVIGFRCAWFYFAAEQHTDVVRLLHDAQDLPMILANFEPE
jgi:hypothetical protein